MANVLRNGKSNPSIHIESEIDNYDYFHDRMCPCKFSYQTMETCCHQKVLLLIWSKNAHDMQKCFIKQ